MDTTLITFHLQTSSSIQSVHLVGSWDNFTKHYPMERDIRRARGQWRGCYAFEGIICDGDDRGSRPKRTGGLKMGQTYYYYYELDNGIETHDTVLPATTSCPYLPGQPVNLLWVPVEIQPLRYRSASMSSMTNGDIKTMNPAHKFVTPRPPPLTHSLARLRTSPSLLTTERYARSLSPKPERPLWSPKAFFGLRSPPSTQFQGDKRGRSSSLSKLAGTEVNGGLRSLSQHLDDERKALSLPHTREPSPQPFKRSHSREESPLRRIAGQGGNSYNPTSLLIADENEGEIEDDDNFATDSTRISSKGGVLTPLSPPPSGSRLPSVRALLTPTSKPLPQLPEESNSSLMLPPADLPRSHFPTSTIFTTLISPTDSHLDLGRTQSVTDSHEDDDDLTADIGSGDEFTYSPLDGAAGTGFHGYSLPDGYYASELTLRKETVPFTSLLPAQASRGTFGGPSMTPSSGNDLRSTSIMDELLSEMGYLGDMILGKVMDATKTH